MPNRSTYFFKTILLSCSFACILTSCMEDLVERDYESDTVGYSNAKIAEARREVNQFVAQNNARPNNVQQNPNNVPVIINDPFAMSNNLGLNNANNTLNPNNVYLQRPNGLMPMQQQVGYQGAGYQSPYGSLANAENNVISPNVFVPSGSNLPTSYQQPTFGSNIYNPYNR